MKLTRLMSALAFTCLFAAQPSAHAWDVEEDGYASDEGVSSEYSSFEADTGTLPETTSEDAPVERRNDSGDSDRMEGEAEAPPPPLPPADDDDGEDLYPERRRTPAYDESGEDDDDGWAPLGTQRHGEGAGRDRGHRADGEADRSPTADNSYFSKRNLGLTAELTLGGLFRQGSLGALESKFGLGLSVSWNLGRMIFDPDLWLLHKGLWIELAWLHPFGASGEAGTEMTRVTQSQNNLSLSVMFGYPLWRLLLYGKLGPALYVGGLNYDVDGSEGHWSVVRGGVVYGVGVHTMFFFNDAIGLSGRIELIGHRRHYYNDLQFTVSVGAAF